MESEVLRLRIFVNKQKELILKFDFEKFGGIANETIQFKNGEFVAEIEKEVSEAMQEIINRWQPKVKGLPFEVLFAEKQRQLKSFSDFETVATELIEEEYGK